MNTYTVTITSKNQITLPADLVRKLKLTQGRQLRIEQRDESFKISPEPSLRDALKPIHEKVAEQLAGEVPPTVEELNEAARRIIAERAGR